VWLSAQDLFLQVGTKDPMMVAVLRQFLKVTDPGQAKPMSAHTSSISAWAAHVDLSSRPTSHLHASHPQTAYPPFELFALPEAQDLIHPFPNTSMFDTPSQQQDHAGDALGYNERDAMVAQRLERFYKVWQLESSCNIYSYVLFARTSTFHHL
jgi:hypothetical protein